MTQQPYQPYGIPPMAPPVYAAPGPYSLPTSTTDPGLNEPWYGIGPIQAYTRMWKKYATFSGRASRGEYWWVVLVNGVGSMVFMVPLMMFGFDWGAVTSGYGTSMPFTPVGVAIYIVMLVYGLAMLVPGLALLVRRLHDTAKSGAWFFISFVPFGGIVVIVFLAMATVPGRNQWDDPNSTTWGPVVPAYPYYPGPPPGATWAPPPERDWR